MQWVPDDMDAISLDYSYNMKAVIRFQDMMGFIPFRDWLRYPVCAALTCRGCTHDCVTCGGSAYSFREHFGRKRARSATPSWWSRHRAHPEVHSRAESSCSTTSCRPAETTLATS